MERRSEPSWDARAWRRRRLASEAVVSAVSAGCDAVLLCGTDCASHASALEALVRAVEQGEISHAQVDDSLARQRRAKARFAGMAGSSLGGEWRPVSPRELRSIVGCPAHQLVAEEMRRFA